MKRYILLLGAALLAVMMWGAKANRQPMVVKMADGTTVTVYLHGDEDLHWYATADGKIVTRQGNTFTYAASQTLPKRAMRKERMGTASVPYFPHTGSPKAICILVNFKDTTFSVSDPKKVFDEYLNAETLNDYGRGETRNYGSVKSYFKAMSFGTYTPQFDVYGPYTVSENMAYYGANSGSTTDVNYQALMKEACALADADINFADYDSDGDGRVDLITFIYAGFGESNGASSNTIWPKSGSTSLGTYDGKSANRFALINELNFNESYFEKYGRLAPINGIGLFCHEFSHTLGLPDIYPTNNENAKIDNQEMEYWDLMDGGEYVYNGYCPAPYTAWEREVMGWSSIETLTGNQDGIQLTPVNDGGKAYKIVNDSDATEYVVIENIQQRGWSQKMPGHGILAYHVKWPSSEVQLYQSINGTPKKPNMAVIPADGVCYSSFNKKIDNKTYKSNMAGDPFPGTSNVTALNDILGLPNYYWYCSSSTSDLSTKATHKALANISEDTSTGIVTFDYIHDTTTGIQHVTERPVAQDNRIYTLDGRYVGKDAGRLQPGIYIQNKKKIMIR